VPPVCFKEPVWLKELKFNALLFSAVTSKKNPHICLAFINECTVKKTCAEAHCESLASDFPTHSKNEPSIVHQTMP
jgi:hypothetical protein